MRSPLLLLPLLAACAPDYEIGRSFDPAEGTGPGGIPSAPGPFDTDGDGVVDGDHFDLANANPTDIVIYGDTSGSMTEELITMGSNILRFTDRLESGGADWRILVVTGPSGCGVDGWFEPTSPDFDSRFSQAIITRPINDAEDEMGLQNVVRSIEHASGGCNDGFVRPNAMLHVIFISDENDESPGFEGANYWQGYLDAMITAKGSQALTKFSAVAGPTPDGCAHADPGFGYDEVVDATSGEFVSICSDWPNRLDTLADASVITDIFPLSEVPRLDTIRPYVNGELRADGWIFDPIENAVVFTSDPPRTGDVVDIFYSPV